MDDVVADYRYCQYAEGFRAKRQVLPIDAIPESDALIDCCTTYFSYGKDMFDYWMENNKTSGYEGECFCRYVPIDIDSDLTISSSSSNSSGVYTNNSSPVLTPSISGCGAGG